jgi:hypothetical protein
MKRKIFLLAWVLGITIGAVAQEEELFTPIGREAVIMHSDEYGDWDDRYTDPGAVLFHDGQFHMFRNGFRGWPATVQIAYHTSPDGVTWTEVSEEPIIRSEDVPFAGLAALASSVVVEDDGTWVLYFYTWESISEAGSMIGRATASDPAGPWTIDPEPVLTPGDDDAWDSGAVNAPRVIKTDEGYVMYYNGSTEDFFSQAIGIATSPDGIQWEKQPDPILQSDQETAFIHQPNVVLTPEGWVMIFRKLDRSGSRPEMSLHYALSDDGLNWTVQDQVIWRRNTINILNGFWWTALAYHDGTYYLYVEGGRGSNTDIYLGTFTGSLPA